MSRLYTFDNILNFRDFGDYPAAGGARVKSSKLFRSAHFNQASQADITRLSALDISLQVDLRYNPERKRQPNLWPSDTGAISAKSTRVLEYPDHDEAEGELAPHEAFVKEILTTPDEARGYMQSSYLARPDDPGFRQIFSATLKHMAASGEPILIHCAAGKDRTGTLAAIILSALGVSSETIMEDYMLTMRAVDIDAYLEPASKMMAKRYGRPISAEAIRPLFSVEPSYLEQSMKTMKDPEKYISDVLGVTQTERQALRDHYLNYLN
jgi:protein-tyrosine phosphatase